MQKGSEVYDAAMDTIERGKSAVKRTGGGVAETLKTG